MYSNKLNTAVMTAIIIIITHGYVGISFSYIKTGTWSKWGYGMKL